MANEGTSLGDGGRGDGGRGEEARSRSGRGAGRRPGWLVVVALLLLGSVAHGQAGDPIQGVVLEGDVGISHSLLRANLRCKQGVPFSDILVDEDTRWLANTHGILADVIVEDGPVVVFRMSRVQMFDVIEVLGNLEYDASELLSAGRLRAEAAATPDEVIRARDLVQEFYLSKGFAFVQVELTNDERDGREYATLRIYEGPRVETTGVTIQGLTALDVDDAKNVMRSVPGLLDWFLGKDFRRDEVNQDVVLLENFVRGEGYLDARVSLDGLDFSDDRSEVEIALYVEEGQRYSVRSIELDGVVALDREALLAEAALQVGQPFRRPDVVRTIRSIQGEYGNRGYIDAVVVPRDGYDLEQPLVDVVFQVAEGQQNRIRDVIIRGNTGTRDEVIRRYLTFYPGEVVDLGELDFSADRLIAQRYFEDFAGQPLVRIDTEETPDPALVDVVVEVGEDQSGVFSFLLGAGSDNGVFGGVTIDKRNFDASRAASSWDNFLDEFFTSGEAYHGGGQRLLVELIPGTETTNADITFTDPWLDAGDENPWGVSYRIFSRTRDFNDYDRDNQGGSVTFSKDLSKRTSINIGGRIEQVDITDVSSDVPTILADEGEKTINALSGGFRYRDVDSSLEPTDGATYGVQLEWSGGPFGGDVDSRRFTFTGEWWNPLDEQADTGKLNVLHNRLALGLVDPTSSSSDFPFWNNYFVGGSSGPFAVRGFDYQGVGPHESDTATGGRLALAGSIEYVRPLVTEYNPFRDEEETVMKGVLFLDIANLQRGAALGDLTDDLRVSAGIGARLRLAALGGVTVAVDLAAVLADESEDETRALSFEMSRRF